MGKKEINKTFRMDDDMERWVGKQLTELDCSLSEFIRASLILAAGQLRENPALLRMVSLDQLKSQQDIRNTNRN